MPVVLQGLDPRVLAALKQIQAQAAARGIQTNLLSAFRTRNDQEQLYANWQAGLHGQPLPYPDRGAVPLAAAPGTSPHEKGYAFDLQATDPSRQSELWSLAPEGVKAFGMRDPAHFELSGGGSGAAPVAVATPAGYTFVLPANAPMGMGNNNPLNIKYYSGAPYAGLVGPSSNTDQGDPQMKFSSPEAGWSAAYQLLGKKYGAGKLTANQIIAGQGGWTPGNFSAAANVAKSAGIGPDEDIRFSDPSRAKAFMRALVAQEQGAAASAYPDAMIDAAIKGSAIPAGAVASSGGSSAPANPTDWQALLGATPPPESSDLSSLMSSAVSGAGAQAPTSVGGMTPMPESALPPVDLSFAPATEAPEALGARYAQGKDARKLTQLGQLFTLKTIGDPGLKPPASPNAYQGKIM